MLGKGGNTAAAVAMLCLGLTGPANASLIDPYKPMARSDGYLSLDLWHPGSRSLACPEHPDPCRSSPSYEAAGLGIQLPPVRLDNQSQPSSEQKSLQKVALLGLPKALRPQLDSIPLAASTLAPMAHTVFCLRYPKDCEISKIAFRGGAFDLTSERWDDLRAVNAEVNRSIRPERNLEGLAGEKWIINPKSGDCNDYAVSKQHKLLARGWPSRTLLLAEVVTNWGEHHLVLVVRTNAGDFVLDNLRSSVVPWSKTGYRWLRMQSPRNPKFWQTVRAVGV
ncbi:transglutaminase-like cysteine peptidase [Rhodoplanes sp. Z2-YC6860]|uniref:transglutaminase-like cysteine peptidase n=1 Tax=Rhodoplanes sp. Z2-YC6860 TaxID=674703 RepID=UPI00078C5035|nr:transglutaminase-like cysteine peptidase [Rhodoplanes sp. Z2-YC6860]AMN43770.1 hypothetical protein RHPLAN_53540 [Rhodoplanes sp. Z2-YC6860]